MSSQDDQTAPDESRSRRLHPAAGGGSGDAPEPQAARSTSEMYRTAQGAPTRNPAASRERRSPNEPNWPQANSAMHVSKPIRPCTFQRANPSQIGHARFWCSSQFGHARFRGRRARRPSAVRTAIVARMRRTPVIPLASAAITGRSGLRTSWCAAPGSSRSPTHLGKTCMASLPVCRLVCRCRVQTRHECPPAHRDRHAGGQGRSRAGRRRVGLAAR